MKQWMVRLVAALSLAVTVSLVAPAHAQKPAAGAPSEADKKAYQDFTTKATAIQNKYMPQIQAVQKKYQPQIEAIKKKYKPVTDKLQAKYKSEADALQKEGSTMKPEDQKGPKGQAFMKKMVDFQNKMKSDPDAKKIEAEMKPIQTKMIGEIKPLAKKIGDEVLAAAPAKFKPMVKQQIDQQMKMMGS
jgi:phage host-nuclease inhibitor protein Gam